jgi:hypothetical protein
MSCFQHICLALLGQALPQPQCPSFYYEDELAHHIITDENESGIEGFVPT